LFCIIKGNEGLGFGKVVENEDGRCVVEYFDSPAKVVRKENVPISQIRNRSLGRNTRVYVKDSMSDHWVVGRVIEDLGDGLEIRLYDKKDIFCEYDNANVRWAKAIQDPLDFISNAITETPQYAEARSTFLSSYISQRGAAWGISALLSSVIELESHQVEVVRRVLSDPCQRYLLADEVGLGKTIEAGVIIRQAVLDDPRNHQIVVLVPRILISQWCEELVIRFGLEAYIDISLHVLDQESGLDVLVPLLEKATMLVIDEVHHLASSANDLLTDAYDAVAEKAPYIDRLLLLSATPILRNENGFLRILHLLDPVVYGLNDEDSFRQKVNNRMGLAESVALLDPENLFFLDGILDDLAQLLPNDELYLDLSQRLKEELPKVKDQNNEEFNGLIRALKSHISETYRLHRRILRNRRKKIKFLTPERAGCNLISVGDSQTEQLESLLERWRIGASSSENTDNDSLEKFYISVLTAIFENIERVPKLCNHRILSIQNDGLKSFDEEANILLDMEEIFDYELWMEHRLNRLLEEILKLIQLKTRIVVFATEVKAANVIFEYLAKSIGANQVVRFSFVDDFEDYDARQQRGFSVSDDVRVVICDQTAEEGVNLQGGSKTLIHFDLPLDPNRIEQRMGRVDRYGSGDPVKSLVIIDKSSHFQAAWYSVLDEGFGVFSNSISSLQYLVEDELKAFFSTILLEGIDSLTDMHERLGGSGGAVEKELKLIDEQDSLDELSQMDEFTMDRVDDVDCDWRGIKESIMLWAVTTLMFSTAQQNSSANEIDPHFRFEYNNPERRGIATLIPLTDFVGKFLGALDFEEKESTHRTPLSFPHCARRQSGVKSGARLIRYGDEFVEALKDFSDVDDRGRSYVIGRHVILEELGEAEGIYFRFDFLVEVDLRATENIVDHSFTNELATANSAISRRGDSLFPPFIEQIWLDQEGKEPPPAFIQEHLIAKYDKNGEQDGYLDTNLKTVKLRKLMDSDPEEFENWDLRCMRMRDIAFGIVSTREHLIDKKKAAIKNARLTDEVRFAQLNSRINSLDKIEAEAESSQLLVERMLSDALAEGIEKPKIKVDVVGAVILSNRALELK
jgi:ATP-dependent helicase HepA